MKFRAVIWKEWVIFRNKFISTTLGALVGPLLYLISFGWGLGNTVQVGDISYTAFVIPGIIAMNSMSSSYGVVANDINISRIYGKTFEALMVAPIQMRTFTVARIIAGALRGLYSAGLILAISFLFQSDLPLDWYFFLVLTLNCLVFASIGFIVGILIDSHGDMAKVQNFVITPMSFLCGTFFPLERLPKGVGFAFEMLPLTQAVKGLRGGLSGPSSWISLVVLSGYFVVLLFVSIQLCKRAE